MAIISKNRSDCQRIPTQKPFFVVQRFFIAKRCESGYNIGHGNHHLFYPRSYSDLLGHGGDRHPCGVRRGAAAVHQARAELGASAVSDDRLTARTGARREAVRDPVLRDLSAPAGRADHIREDRVQFRHRVLRRAARLLRLVLDAVEISAAQAPHRARHRRRHHAAVPRLCAHRLLPRT